MSVASHQAVPRLNLLWFAVLAAPMLIGIAVALMIWVGGYQAAMTLLPTDTLRMAALGAMALMLVVARPLRNALLDPHTLARRPLQGRNATSQGDPATLKVQTSMFLLLGLLDAVAMVVIALCLMQADAPLALLNGVYSLVLAVIARPDFATLVADTRHQLRHS